MKIEHGKKYVTRGGDIVTVELRNISFSYPWTCTTEEGMSWTADEDGFFYYRAKELHDYDIVAEHKETVLQDKSVVYVYKGAKEYPVPLSSQYRIVGEHPDYSDSFICVSGCGYVGTYKKNSLILYKQPTANELFCKDLVEGEVVFVRNDDSSGRFTPRQFKEYDSVTDSILCWSGYGSEELMEWKYATKENPRLKSNKPSM